MRILPIFCVLLLAAAPMLPAQDPTPRPMPDINSLILHHVATIPSGGKYAANKLALVRLQSSLDFERGKFFKIPTTPFPSFCSGATYIIFVRTLEQLRREGHLTLEYGTLDSLIIRGQRDGEGIWGRWNANGPGTARLFHELDLGPNFAGLDRARPGDFMKIFWTKEVGRAERGHSVIYLGTEQKEGVEHVRFWSSNQPDGYGAKSVPRSEIAHAIFSRLENPANLDRASRLPAVDPYLASLLKVRSSFVEAKKKSGI